MNTFGFEPINWSPYFGAPPPDLAEVVTAASGAGYDWVSFERELLDAHLARGGTLRDLRRRCEDAGLRVLAIHSVALGDDPDAALEACGPIAAAAEALGAPWLQVAATTALGDALYATTSAVARRAREHGAALGVEFLPFLPVDSIAATRALLEAADAEGSGLVVDSWHFFHGPDDWSALEGVRGDEVAYVQFDDHPPLESEDLLVETTQRRVVPGRGTFDLDRFATTLRGGGFEGAVAIEHLSAEDRRRPMGEVARELLDATRPIWRPR